ncbi:MAG TPA: Rieske (2Fe-2S) protein, partial [Candidatus Acidoferrales bacterium]|nr:Rieske (2Fe-2S) protein [Candidatus Acidoferrales bacterium]
MQAPAVTSRLERLRACWHGAAYARDVGTTPYRTELLGERLVIWRDSRGTPHAFRDLCIHRGTALSLGSVAGDE